MLHDQLQSHGTSLVMDVNPSQVSNTANGMIVGTVSGGATLADSSVAPLSRSQATSFSVTSRSQLKVASRQLRKEGGHTT